ncbi:MAG: hypothetical protein ACFB6S_15010 [Geminicoccaceae bacterium]
MPRLNRRDFAGRLGLAGASLALAAHTPYRQWQVYRQKHLLIGCHKDDPKTYALAKAIVGLLQDHLPDAQARPARAPRAARLASLMGTGQLQTAVLAPKTAMALAVGTAPFENYGPTAIGGVVRVDGYVLVARNAAPHHHVWLLTEALMEAGNAPGSRFMVEPPSALDPHAGAASYFAGEPPHPPEGSAP